MTSPVQLAARISALEEAVTQMRTGMAAQTDAFTQAITRLTAVEQSLAAARPRLTFLEEAATGFTTRVGELEAVSHAPSNADAARVEALEVIVAELQAAVSRLGQAVRPGRTVMRERMDDLQASVAEILTRLPPAPSNGGTPR